MNGRRKRRRDLERWHKAQPSHDQEYESCLNCGTPLWSDDECFASESGDGWFCRSCCIRENEADGSWDDGDYFDDDPYHDDDFDDLDDEDLYESWMPSDDQRLGQEKHHGFDVGGYERRERLDAIAECPKCGAEVECWAETDCWVEGDNDKWNHEGYGGAMGHCDQCNVLLADCLSDGFQAFDVGGES